MKGRLPNLSNTAEACFGCCRCHCHYISEFHCVLCASHYADICRKILERRRVPRPREAKEGREVAQFEREGLPGMDEIPEANGLELLEIVDREESNPWFTKGIPFGAENWRIIPHQVTDTEEVRGKSA